MSRTLYALLVGIDRYPAPVTPLAGCSNDVAHMRDYLRGRYDSAEFRLDLTELLDERATRQAVIDAFRGHLGRAGTGDVALFYYSGHGSQERAPEAFWHLEPDRLDETLVCWDSRLPGRYDLADKELAHLIEGVAAGGAHVVVVLDSCHSGSGTRNAGTQEAAVRRVPTDLRDRPLDSFIMTVADADRLARNPAAGGGSGWAASGRHVLLAACRDDEEAVEYHAAGPDGRVEPRGTFSYFLGEALRSAAGPLTYRDLFARANALVRAQVPGQSPQLEAAVAADLDAVLFDGAIRPSAPYYTLACTDGEWWVDGGAVHGLPPASADEAALLDTFPFGTPGDDLRNPGKATARVRLVQILPTRSRVEVVTGSLSPGEAYKAVVVALPLPRVTVRIEPGDGPAAELARTAILRANGVGPSLYVREAKPGAGEAARFVLRAGDGGFVITSPESDRPLVAPVPGLTEAAARQVIQRLEHMARWTLVAELTSAGATSRPADIELVLLDEAGEELRGSEIRLEYRHRNGQPQPAKFKIRLANRTPDKTLFCGLLDLTQTYAIAAGLHEAGCVRLGPGEEAFVLKGRFIQATLPDKLWREGVVEFTDILKLIVADREFDVRLMTQGPLDLLATKSVTQGLPRGSLNRLMQRVVTRHLAAADTADEVDTWWATQVPFVTVRPQESTPVPATPGGSAALAGGVRVLDHPVLRARARLSTAPVSSRDLGALALPRLLRDDPDVCGPFPLVGTRGTEPAFSTLELTDVEGDTYQTVTPAQPLRLLVPRPLGAGESVLAVGHDGEFFLPLGHAAATPSGGAELVLERLPAPTSGGRKSLSGSIKIFFQKVIGARVGVPSEYPILAAVKRLDPDGRFEYTKDPAEVRQLVVGAGTVLLYVHGIIGDTLGMAASALRRGLDRRYDLVLTFDYENLNTPIAENARLLGRRLADAGLGAGHDKALDVVAHSMGGLVSRWFVEREGGARVVRRLVMLGTPNGGSPWPTVVDWATAALALGLNNLTGSPWPAIVLKGLAKAVGDPRVALREMQPGSATLAKLAESADPGIPYTLLAGNTSVIPAAKDQGLVGRLLTKLFGASPAYTLTDQFFQGAANDIAVSIESMKQVPAGRPLATTETACDHLTYFTDETALDTLIGALSDR